MSRDERVLYKSFVWILYKEQLQFKNRTNTIELHLKPSRQSERILTPYTEENMQKRLAIFLVVALVIAVANLPPAQGFSGNTNWKRALEVRWNMFLVSIFCENTKRSSSHNKRILGHSNLKLVFI